MEEREGRGLVLYVLLDVATDPDARAVGERLGAMLGELDERVIGFALGDVEPIDLTFEDESGNGAEHALSDEPGR
ncbi:MAG TPA: hypothetical protein VFI22_13710 [Thermomicrobiales bacterium]|nr:hypothetical protein [Thermomicrobiales bacterium]